MNRRQLLLSAAALPLTASTAHSAPDAAIATSSSPQPPADSPETPPALRREFRGVWVATVANIDWPSKPGLSVETQQTELRAILDRSVALHLNAVILQVRPSCDALYASEIEPWSEYLTGQQGRAPEPFYDPLEFAVAEAHARGLELHAWFNPYRARPAGAGPVAANHIAKTNPDVVKSYGKMLWLDPGEPVVQQRSRDVILDVVKRYDIDGVHLDDYFYPYKEADPKTKKDIPFPDERSWQKYRANGGTLARDDWRRSNVDDFVSALYAGIKELKPWVKFGISPFGIWRPGVPPQIKGYDAYANLYADSRKWLREGWCDYFTPQLYWKIDQTGQSFAVLLTWWAMQNEKSRHLWPGLYTSKYAPVEIEYQTRVTRGFTASTGNIHFSMATLQKGSLDDSKTMGGNLKATVYDEAVAVPASPWLGSSTPDSATDVAAAAGGVSWNASRSRPFVWAIQWKVAGAWFSTVVPGDRNSVEINAEPEAVAVTAIDRLGNASMPAVRTVG